MVWDEQHTREKELEVVAREKAVRMNMFNEAGTKSQDQIIQEAADDKEPSLTPLMQLRLVLEQVCAHMSTQGRGASYRALARVDA